MLHIQFDIIQPDSEPRDHTMTSLVSHVAINYSRLQLHRNWSRHLGSHLNNFRCVQTGLYFSPQHHLTPFPRRSDTRQTAVVRSSTESSVPGLGQITPTKKKCNLCWGYPRENDINGQMMSPTRSVEVSRPGHEDVLRYVG